MPLDLYYTLPSPPCRAVLLAAKAAGIELNLKHINLMAGEHMTPDFIKMNQKHTVPTLHDNGLYLNESRVILTYLISKYAKNDALYPKDPAKRAIVDLRLQFDLGTLMNRGKECYVPQAFMGKPANPDAPPLYEEALSWLNNMLAKSKWVAGDSMTVADCTIIATVTQLEVWGFDPKKYSNIARWYDLCKKEMSGYKEINEKGIESFRELLATFKAKK